MQWKQKIKKVLPPRVITFYHKLLAILANIIYRYPSRKLVVIGITGTKGKSTTANMVWQILTKAGNKVGLITTANFRIGDKEWINATKMTMPGRLRLQKLLRQMVKIGCRYAIIETSSEGIKQFRHWGIKYQIGVFTNLTPEHIESHGSFANYRAAKAELFKNLSGLRISILNKDDNNFSYYKNIPAQQYIYYGLEKEADYFPVNLQTTTDGWQFEVKGHLINVNLPGVFNVYNAMAAIATAKALQIKWLDISQALNDFKFMPGRMEKIISRKGFVVYVDYAHTPESLELVYKTLQPKGKRLIAVLGSCGGGRDKAKRPVLGKLAASYAQVVIITNEDPYDEDPKSIIEEVFAGTISFPSVEVYKVEDRRQAIEQAIKTATVGDIVVITGKGSEQVIVTHKGKIPWDDRVVVRESLAKL